MNITRVTEMSENPRTFVQCKRLVLKDVFVCASFRFAVIVCIKYVSIFVVVVVYFLAFNRFLVYFNIIVVVVVVVLNTICIVDKLLSWQTIVCVSCHIIVFTFIIAIMPSIVDIIVVVIVVVVVIVIVIFITIYQL